MAELSNEGGTVKARILYWGVEGAGKSANLEHVYRKLRADHRGELRSIPTPLDPSVSYESLPIRLGKIGGVDVALQVVTTPGGPEHAPTRKKLLDRVDGVVFVIDSQPSRLEDNLEAFDELRRALGAYGRSLESVPLVLQYNKRDLSDDLTLEELHRKLDLTGVPLFECIAPQGKNVLQTLTTISKRVIRHLREHGPDSLDEERAAEAAPPITPPPAAPIELEPLPEPGPAPIELEPLPEPGPAPIELAEPAPLPATAVEAEILREAGDPDLAADADAVATVAEAGFQDRWDDLAPAAPAPAPAPAGSPEPAWHIERVGDASVTGDLGLRLPLVLRDARGRRVSFALDLKLDSLTPEDET